MKSGEHRNLILQSVSSFEHFFRMNYHLACLVALRYLKDQQIAEDVVQETFMGLWQKRNELTIESNLKQYLLRAVRNRSLNYLERSRQFDQLTDAAKELAVDEEQSVYADEELAVRIARSIEMLPPQCKKIFLLAYQDDLTYNEIAERLNLSKNTIKTQMGIAYKILREKLKSYFLNLFILPFRQLMH